MTTIDFRIEAIGKEYMKHLIKLKEGEKIEVIGFGDKEKLREFATRMLSSERMRKENYITYINDEKLSYIVKRTK